MYMGIVTSPQAKIPLSLFYLAPYARKKLFQQAGISKILDR